MKLDDFRKVIRRIPKGAVMTYGEVAAAAGHPGAARQVVWALRNSGPDMPWHRVVGAGNRIRLPAQAGLEQRLRLEMEGCVVRGTKVIPRRPVLHSSSRPKRAPRQGAAGKS